MKFLKIASAAMIVSLVFIACTKEKDMITQQSKETPQNVPASPVQGIWTGQSYGVEKSIPVYLEFNIKPDGTMDVLNEAKKITGTGGWLLTGKNFNAAYTVFASGNGYSFAAELNNLQNNLNGTWGHNTSHTDGGFWNMDKQK